MEPLLPPSWIGLAIALAVGASLRLGRADGWSALLGALVAAPALALQDPAGSLPPPARALLVCLAPALGSPTAGGPLLALHLGPMPDSLPACGVGLPGLALALLAACVGRGPCAWLGRGLVLLGVGLVLLGGDAVTPWPAALVSGLGLLAGVGLHGLRQRRAEGAAMALSWVVVALAAGSAMAALQAGAATDAEALAPWLPEGRQPPRLEIPALAAGLRTTLDQLAIVAFASMTAVLVFLRARGRVGTLLLLLVAALDAARPWSPL